MSLFDYTFYVESREMCIEIECVLEYEPEEGDGYHLPRIPASATLVSAKVGGKVDIVEALTDEQVEAIEHDAMVWHAEDLADMADAVDTRESRRNADYGLQSGGVLW